ncbi:MAG: adenine deaminase [Anaerolineae bacterium]|nr:adenine deaminase [Anaerolineae bacterium]NIN95939.1 adenine deaminase [Anaerolineae bacterium]NIQ78903.1 adenine deaminase [Anaerolineae bacterium]
MAVYAPQRRKLGEVTRTLVDAAMGRDEAEVVIRGGRLVNVHTAEIQDGVDVAIKAGRVVLVGQAEHTIGGGTELIDASGYYLLPGLMEGHVHIESSMITPTQFARAVLPHGTTAVFIDNHELANVLGIEGIKVMMEEARHLPLKVYLAMPSCVPAMPGFEDAGAVIGPPDVSEAMGWDYVAGLGEMMNMPGVIDGDRDVHAILRATLDAGKVVTGHYSIPETERGLQAFIAAGISSCHESTRMEDALAKLRLGMFVMLREGSAWHDLKETIRAISDTGVDSRHAMIVTDDTHPDTLINVGHLNHVVRRAIEEGLEPVRAVQMATVNVAEYFRLGHDLGSVSPGKCADIIFVRDLKEMRVDKVLVDGVLVAEGGQLSVELPDFSYPDSVRHSVRLPRALGEDDFMIRVPDGASSVTVRVIEVQGGQVVTRHVQVERPVLDGTVAASASADLAKVASVERHKATGQIGLGFVTGFGLKDGAVASTIAHDSHNLLIVGTNEADMAFAGNTLVRAGGGMVAVRDGEVLALVPLPIAGLMSQEPVEVVDDEVQALARAWHELGCDLPSPFMTMSILALPVIPELRITNRGLVDTVQFTRVDTVIA